MHSMDICSIVEFRNALCEPEAHFCTLQNIEADTATIGGWALTMLEGEAEEGSSFTWENLEITVLKTDGFRIERIGVCELYEIEDED